MTAPIIPAGVANLADRLEEWRAIINAKVGGVAAVKSADTSRTSTTAYTDDPHLSVPVVANGVYRVEFRGHFQSPVAAGGKFQFTFPSGTMEVPMYVNDPSTADIGAIVPGSSPIGQAGFTTTGGNLPIELYGTLFVGATGGNLKVQWAQQTSNATAIILRKGTSLVALRIS